LGGIVHKTDLSIQSDLITSNLHEQLCAVVIAGRRDIIENQSISSKFGFQYIFTKSFDNAKSALCMLGKAEHVITIALSRRKWKRERSKL
jgi:hypothetical protein